MAIHEYCNFRWISLAQPLLNRSLCPMLEKCSAKLKELSVNRRRVCVIRTKNHRNNFFTEYGPAILCWFRVKIPISCLPVCVSHTDKVYFGNYHLILEGIVLPARMRKDSGWHNVMKQDHKEDNRETVDHCQESKQQRINLNCARTMQVTD